MADFLNKFMEMNNLDGLVPTLELEDLYPEDTGPLLKDIFLPSPDHFLGVVNGLSGDQPLCVVFVDPNANNTNGDQQFHGNTIQNSTNGNHFYDEYTAPSWLEHNFDLNDLDSLGANSNFSPPDSVSTAPFVDNAVAATAQAPAQNFIPDAYDYDYSPKYAQEAKFAPQQKHQQHEQALRKKTQFHTDTHRSEPETTYSDYYYDASSESMISSVHSNNSWESTEEECPSKEAILEEIHREAAEIERFSVSPPASKHSIRKSKSTIAKPTKLSRTRPRKLPKSFVERKKELNRQAATKYREKKRAEREYLHNERESLETRNTELKAEVTAMASEIEYLKKLIKDIEARTKH